MSSRGRQDRRKAYVCEDLYTAEAVSIFLPLFNLLAQDMKHLLMDDDVTCKTGIVPYLLSGRTKHDEKHLSLRAFSEAQKMQVYERQGHKRPYCQRQGIETEYDFENMQGDHIIPWFKGGCTVDENLQMLCRKCNNDKGGD